MPHLKSSFYILSLFLFVFSIKSAYAEIANPSPSESVPCGILKKFDGEVEVLNANRTHVLDLNINGPIPCGAWIYVQEGWILVQHQSGYDIRLSSHSLAEIFDSDHEDPIVLFKGQVMVEALKGSSPVSVLTANARAKMKYGNVVLIFYPDLEKTQLVVIKNSATFENRFENGKSIKVDAGEVSSLDFKVARVLPEAPRTVNATSLKTHLTPFGLNEKEMRFAFEKVDNRRERNVANFLQKPTRNTRAIASFNDDVERQKKLDRQYSKMLMKKSVGESSEGVPMLYPKEFKRGPSSVVIAPDVKKREKEKGRVIEEISRIYTDDSE